MRYFLYTLLFFALFLVSCKKDDPILSVVPELELISVGPLVVAEYSDSLVFEIGYTDGDGDLGENNADARNLFLTDQRINVTYDFRIPELAPPDANIAIKGRLRVVLPHIGIVGSGNSEKVNFSIYCKDRSGNVSNTITAGPVTVRR